MPLLCKLRSTWRMALNTIPWLVRLNTWSSLNWPVASCMLARVIGSWNITSLASGDPGPPAYCFACIFFHHKQGPRQRQQRVRRRRRAAIPPAPPTAIPTIAHLLRLLDFMWWWAWFGVTWFVGALALLLLPPVLLQTWLRRGGPQSDGLPAKDEALNCVAREAGMEPCRWL